MGSEEAVLRLQIAKASAITNAAAILFSCDSLKYNEKEAYRQAEKFADKAFKEVEKEWK